MYIKNIIFLAFAFSLKDLSCLAALIQVCMLVHYQKVFPVSDHNNNIDTSVDGGLSFAGKQRTGGTLESMIDHTLTCSTLDSLPASVLQLSQWLGGSSTKVKEDKKKYTGKVLGPALIIQVC